MKDEKGLIASIGVSAGTVHVDLIFTKMILYEHVFCSHIRGRTCTYELLCKWNTSQILFC